MHIPFPLWIERQQGCRRTLRGALKRGTEEAGSTMVAQTQLPQTQHPCTAVPHTKAADRWAFTPSPSSHLPVCTTEFPLPALDLPLLRHPFNPLAPYLLCPQPFSLSWLLASSLFCLQSIPFLTCWPLPVIAPSWAFLSQPNLLTRGVCKPISHFLTSHLPQSGFSSIASARLASHSHL